MKLQKFIPIVLLTAMFIAMIAGACRRKDDTTVEDLQTNQEISNDESDANNEIEDLASQIDQNAGTNMRIESNAICGGVVANNPSGGYTITFNNATTCNGNRTRTGTIDYKMVSGTRWTDQGATLQITYNNFKVTFNRTGKTIVVNGTHTISNVNGGRITDITGSNGTVINRRHRVRMQVQFNNGTTRTWTTARLNTWQSEGGVLTFVSRGDSTYLGTPNTLTIGTSRGGVNFNIVTTTPTKTNFTCGWWKPFQGERTINGNGTPITVTLGVDSQGNAPATPATACPTNFKVTWRNSEGVTRSYVLPY